MKGEWSPKGGSSVKLGPLRKRPVFGSLPADTLWLMGSAAFLLRWIKLDRWKALEKDCLPGTPVRSQVGDRLKVTQAAFMSQVGLELTFSSP